MRGAILFVCSLLLSFSIATKPTWPTNSYKTGSWEPPHLQVNKTDGAEDGLIFISVRNPNKAGTAVTIYDNDGNPVYMGPKEVTMDFKVQKLYGEDVLIYWSGEHSVPGGYGYGKVHILNRTYKEIHTITLTGDFVTATGEARESYIDVHEHYITPENTIIVSAINVTQVDLTSVGGHAKSWINACKFYEIDIATNEVIFAWNPLDHQDGIPLWASRRPVHNHVSRRTPWDPYHMNSVTPARDGYLVSLRFYWSAFYLNRDGSVRWQFSGADDGTGDFTGEDLRFSWQHHARVYNETETSLILSLFNNANARTAHGTETTGMAYEVDLLTHTASLLYNISDPDDSIRSKTQGSFQFLDTAGESNIFMGYGSIPVVKEYNADGKLVLSGQFGARGHAQSYRGFKFPWVGIPFWKPVVVTSTHSTSTEVYMSWNGATEYDNRAVYSVPSPSLDKAASLARHPRTGFETRVDIERAAGRYIQVAACRGEEVLGWSEAVLV